METYKADQIADWFLNQQSMSPKKLQKLLYYAYAWVLTLYNDNPESLDNRLFNEQFEAWVHGPVLKSIYDEYKSYGYHQIKQIMSKPSLTPDIENTLEQVWDVYGDYSADQLESITHQEDPWKLARKGLSVAEAGHTKISDKIIFNYYIQRMAE